MCKGRRGLTVKRRPGKPPIPKNGFFYDVASAALEKRKEEKNGKNGKRGREN